MKKIKDMLKDFLSQLYLIYIGIFKKGEYKLFSDKFNQKVFLRIWKILTFIIVCIAVHFLVTIPNKQSLEKNIKTEEFPKITIENKKIKSDKIYYKKLSPVFGIIVNTKEELSKNEIVSGKIEKGKTFTLEDVEAFSNYTIATNAYFTLVVTKDEILLMDLSNSESPSIYSLLSFGSEENLISEDDREVKLYEEFLSEFVNVVTFAVGIFVFIFVGIIYLFFIKPIGRLILWILYMLKRIEFNKDERKKIVLYSATLPYFVLSITSILKMLNYRIAIKSAIAEIITILIYVILLLVITFKLKYSKIDKNESNEDEVIVMNKKIKNK